MADEEEDEDDEEEEEDEEDVKEPRLPIPDDVIGAAEAAMCSPLGNAEGTGGGVSGGGGGGWKAAAAAATTPTTGDCESGRRDRRCDNDVAVVVAAPERFTTPSSSGL